MSLRAAWQRRGARRSMERAERATLITAFAIGLGAGWGIQPVQRPVEIYKIEVSQMKVTIWGIWEIRHRRFYAERDIVFISYTKRSVIHKIISLGRYHSDGGVLLRAMPIYLKHCDNLQIFAALKISK